MHVVYLRIKLYIYQMYADRRRAENNLFGGKYIALDGVSTLVNNPIMWQPQPSSILHF